MTSICNSFPAGTTNEPAIQEFEKYIGHRLPDSYKAFLLDFNGGYPEPNALILDLDGQKQEVTVMCFFPMRDLSLGNVEVMVLEQLRVWPLHCAWNDLQHDLVHLYQQNLTDTLLPIGTDGSSNYFCLVLTGDRQGSVLFFDHEMAETVELAESFPAFLSSLRPKEVHDYADISRTKALEKACLNADDKFRKKDYKAVVLLLSPFESLLETTALMKLQYAKKRCHNNNT